MNNDLISITKLNELFSKKIDEEERQSYSGFWLSLEQLQPLS